MLKHTYLIFIFTVVVILAQSQAVLALEITYPIIPGAHDINTNPTLINYINYFFIFAIVTAGFIGVISIVISGLQILAFAGSLGVVGAAKERIIGSILGIILLMLSFVILRTINPELIAPQETPVGLLPTGVYYSVTNPNGTTTYTIAKDAISNTADPSQMNQGYTQLLYKCDRTPGNPGRTLLVWVYSEPDFLVNPNLNGSPNTTTYSIPCGSTVNNPIDIYGNGITSFHWEYEDAGVYYFLKKDCDGISSSDIQKVSGSIPSINQSIDDTILSLRIVSGKNESTRYGVILNRDIGGDGECSKPIINSIPGSVCYNVSDHAPNDANGKPFTPLFTDIIAQNPNYLSTGRVDLYSEHLNAKLTADDIGLWYTYKGDPITHNLTGDGDPDNLFGDQGRKNNDDDNPAPDEECLNQDVQCLKSIESNTAYYVILYSQNNVGKVCDIFANGIKDLNAYDLLDHGRTIYRMDIIPQAP